MKTVKKKIIRKRTVQILSLQGIQGIQIYRSLIIVWLICAICMITYYELMINPNESSVYYLPLKNPEEFGLDPLPIDKRLIDLKNFKFLKNQYCGNTSSFLIALVPSSPGHSYHRDIIRLTWGKYVKVLFLLGESEEYRKDLDKESTQYGDLIQGNFIDSYKNMSYKHVMGLKWVSTFCSGVRYILKADDDVFVHVDALIEWLIRVSPHGALDLIACQMETQRQVHRSPKSKWNVPYEVYPNQYYPEFCRGWAIVYSQDVVLTLYLESLRVRYFWIDDVFVTGIIAERRNKRISRLLELAVTDNKIISNIIRRKYKQPFLFVLTNPNKFTDLYDAINLSDHFIENR